MQDPEFEKQVRQKMEELKFSPSASVWDKVEREIKKEPRSKRPMLFMLTGVVLSGIIYLFLATPAYRTHKITKSQTEQNKLSSDEKKFPGGTDEKKSAGKELTKDKNANQSRFPSTSNPGQQSKKGRIGNYAEKNTNLPGGRAKSGKNGWPIATNANWQKEKEKKNNLASTHKNKSTTIAPPNEVAANQPGKQEKLLEEKNDSSGIVAGSKNSPNAVPVVVHSDSNALKNTRKDSAAGVATTAKSIKTKKSKPWTMGFAGSAGISNIYQNLFNYTSTNAVNSANPASSYGAPGYSYSSPTMQSGFSFSAGMVIQKTISQKLLISTGLSYHYYSTCIRTGGRVDSVSYVNGLPASSSIVYYRRGIEYSYTNHYHFLEIPIDLQWQLNSGKKLPLVWEAGLLMSGLISSDELHFNSSSGIYYKDMSLFNRLQVSVASAILIGWHYKQHVLFQAGPQVEYGLTGMLSSGSGSQHLFFGGLKIVALLPRKN